MKTSEAHWSNTASNEPLLRPVMPELDSIRGLAILAVLVYHGLYWHVNLSVFPKFERLLLTAAWTGRLGVNLFFVLSGFLITGLLLDSRQRKDYYRRFYIRRALRILPAYLAVIAVLAVTRYATPAFLLLSLAYFSNLTPLFGVAVSYPVLWSLAVEEHFYFLWPAMLRKLPNRGLLWSSVGIVLLSPVSRLVNYYATYKNGFVSFVCNDYTWNSLDGLACGAILAVLVREFQRDRKVVGRIACISAAQAAVIWITGLPLGIVSRQRPYGAAMQVVPWHFSFVSILCVFLLIGTSRWKAMVQPKLLRFFGEISYGLYLIHLLIFDLYDWMTRQYRMPGLGHGPFADLLLRFAVAGGAATLLSWLSRRQFEDRFLNLKNRFS